MGKILGTTLDIAPQCLRMATTNMRWYPRCDRPLLRVAATARITVSVRPTATWHRRLTNHWVSHLYFFFSKRRASLSGRKINGC